MAEGIEGLRALMRRVVELETDTKHVERPLSAAGEYTIGSVTQNFLSGGRPSKWKELAASTIARRRRGRGRGGIKILIDRGHLMKALTKRVFTDGVAVGENVVYAPRQHFGYPGGSGRGHAKTPARPFLMLQTEDAPNIGKIFERHLARRG